jgi:DnaJ family protein C protein 28
LKSAYLESCKRCHPDLNATQDNQQFLQIESAYHKLKQYLESKRIESQTTEEEEQDDNRVKHKVPQHRQYLSFDGEGFGTPSDRMRQYEKQKLIKATDSVHEFQLKKIQSNSELSQNNSIILRDPNLQRQIKVKQGFDRLVEDLIQESMAKGEFDNLPGSGKPLKYRPEVPYLDSMTYKLNEILINNGFVPEWVVLEKEIREERNSIRKELILLRNEKKLDDIKTIEQMKTKVKKLNFKIDKYNSVVPIITKQQIHCILKIEINKIKDLANDNNNNELKSNLNQNENLVTGDAKNVDKNSGDCNKNSRDCNENSDNLIKKIVSLFS